MKAMRFQSLLCLATTAFVTTVVSAADVPSCQVRLRVSNTAGGHDVMLVNPSLTVRQGQPASISVTSGDQTYSFDLLVTPQNGELSAEVKAKVTKGKELVASPRITAVVSKPASISLGDLKIDVDAQPVNGGA